MGEEKKPDEEKKDGGDEKKSSKPTIVLGVNATDAFYISDYPDKIHEGGLISPGWLYGKLYKYQRKCIKWQWALYRQNAGGLIGDEMGLGKTVQVLGMIESLRHSGIGGPILIIVPPSVLMQWGKEFKKWSPKFRLYQDHSSNEEELDFDAMIADCKATQGRTEAGIIMTFGGLDKRQKDLFSLVWGYIVLDEGHKVKDPDANTTMICKQLKSYHRMLLTGCPMQNNLKDFWSIFDFVFPGCLGTFPIFEKHVCKPIEAGGYVDATLTQKQISEAISSMLKKLIAPYIIRRTKAEVNKYIGLKGLTKKVVYCLLTPFQHNIYQKILVVPKKKKDIDAAPKGQEKMNLLRTISNHPDMLDRVTFFEKHRPDLLDQNRELKDPDYGHMDRSGKLQVIIKLFNRWKEGGNRCLVFFQQKTMLDIVSDYCAKVPYKYFSLHGGTPVAVRQKCMLEFNSNEEYFVFLITTKAGGTGMNLTGADKAIVVTPDWNPASDEQTFNRCYRIGQKKDVTICRLITRGTIEDKIYQRQVFKTALNETLVKSGGGGDVTKGATFDKANLNNLFSMRDIENVYDCKTGIAFDQYQGDENMEVTTTSGVPDAEPEADDARSQKMLMAVANDAANDALAAMEESGEDVRSAPLGCPTFTGKRGMAGQEGFGGKKKDDSGGDPNKKKTRNFSELMTVQLTEFFSKRGARGVTSEEILRAFNKKLRNDGQTFQFKRILKEVARKRLFEGDEKPTWFPRKKKT